MSPCPDAGDPRRGHCCAPGSRSIPSAKANVIRPTPQPTSRTEALGSGPIPAAFSDDDQVISSRLFEPPGMAVGALHEGQGPRSSPRIGRWRDLRLASPSPGAMLYPLGLGVRATRLRAANYSHSAPPKQGCGTTCNFKSYAEENTSSLLHSTWLMRKTLENKANPSGGCGM
jgi:hypothetical protein